jgi:hypothetical protein
MKKYFIHLNGRSVGPYTFEELRNMRIQPTTPVWFDGLGNWKNAGDVLELKGLFNASPQTFYQQQNYSNPGTTTRSTSTFTNTNLSGNIAPDNTTRNIIIIIVVAVILVFAGIGAFVYYKQQKIREAQEEMMRDQEYQEQTQSDAQALIDSLNAVVSADTAGLTSIEDYGSSEYSGRFNNYSGGILTVKGSGTTDLNVKLEYNSADGCYGTVEGTGREIENHKIKMRTSDGCSLTIRYSTGFVNIEESPACAAAHGSDCSFDGIYSKEH